MSIPLVTVFIPVYNGEKYIRESLESILYQTYQNLEILIVDDGSTDNTVKIVKSFHDSRIRLLINEENKGIPYTRNRGLAEANGKYLAIMDADDISYPHRIQKQVEFMEKNPEIDVAASYYKMIGGKLNKTFKPKFIKKNELKIDLLFANSVGNPTSMIRMETIKKHNLRYNENYFVSQDYGMWTEISKIGNLVIMPDVLLKYRFGHENISKKSEETKWKKRKIIIDSIHKNLLDYYGFNLNDKELETYNNFFSERPEITVNKNVLNNLPNVIKKLINHNRKNSIFDSKLFIEIMYFRIINNLSGANIPLSEKFKLYKLLNKCRDDGGKVEEKLFIVLKHFYKKSKNRENI